MSVSANESVRTVLEAVVDPNAKESIVRLGMVRDIQVRGGKARIDLVLPSHRYVDKANIVESVERAAAGVEGIEGVTIDERVEVAGRDAGETIADVKNVVAVASGKGGVGKSTLAANIAMVLARDGARVGLLDCDVYGPSVPTIMGRDGAPTYDDERRIRPGRVQGVSVLSMGYMVEEDTPMVWRGPMLHGALTQFLDDVSWGSLDYLVLDLPPGTGDIQLTLSQKVTVSGALIVTTPQGVALEDVERGKTMFDDVQIETLGVVENMSYFICPACDKRHYLFGHGGAKSATDRLGLPLLGEIPVDLAMRIGADEADPIVLRDPDGSAATAIRDLAAKVTTRIAVKNLLRSLV
ncbi:MAG: hypothetical protein CME06_05275 [Gemmatimonadetes bacterium]|nr:hypothetical protein [Gemmatimonadota bacterium]